MLTTTAPSSLPRIEGRTLLIDDIPTVLLGGQLHNSTSSSIGELDAVFARIRALNASFVIGTVSWALMEPEPGGFDFSHVDAQITAARAHDLRLVLLWFGAFKNAASTYAPSWVRRDTSTFPRARWRPGRTSSFTDADSMRKPVLSVFSPALREADRAAFTALVEHLTEVDPVHTVVMVQVENEVGLLGDSRDRSQLAEDAWEQQVPAALTDYLVTHREHLATALSAVWERGGARRDGTWSEVFGTDWEAEEVFMAWGFSSYVNAVAEGGAQRKPLPYFANAWLGPQPGQPQAGQYPSGGPGARVIDIWKACAPALDLVGPDVYIDDVKTAIAPYVRDDNPLFIPESKFAVGNVFWALGSGSALGFSVFGVEDARENGQLAQAYSVLGGMRGIIARAQAENRIAAVLLEGDEKVDVILGDMTIRAQGTRARLNRMFIDAGVHAPPLTPPPAERETVGEAVIPGFEDQRPFGLLIREADAVIVVGQGLSVDILVEGHVVEIDSVQRGRYDHDTWVATRTLNGDELLQVVPLDTVGAAAIRTLRLPADR